MRGDGESFPLWAHPSPLFSQKVCGVTRLGGQHAFAMATIGPELLRWKATPPPLCPPALYRRMALPLNVCQAQHGGSRTASQEYTVYNLIWKEYGMEKIPLPTEPEQENNGRWRKNNTGASLSMEGGFSTEGNYGISFNLISTHAISADIGTIPRLSNLSSSMEQEL